MDTTKHPTYSVKKPLRKDATYKFKVRAVSACGAHGEFSNELSVLPSKIIEVVQA